MKAERIHLGRRESFSNEGARERSNVNGYATAAAAAASGCACGCGSCIAAIDTAATDACGRKGKRDEAESEG
jgi:hypothetical protein